MNRIFKAVLVVSLGMILTVSAFAGDPQRSGEAGATQLVVNPWANSSGQGGANMASVAGVEAMSLNPAGILNVRNDEFEVSHVIWLSGLGVSLNSFGLCQKIGKDKENCIGLMITSFDFGNIPLTTENAPENTGQTFNISMLNIGLDFAHRFSDNITAGILLRGVDEGIPSTQATGLALDAGIQYVAGKSDRYHFGVSLRNVGPSMTYSGSGLSSYGLLDGTSNDILLNKPSQDFELPSILDIAGGYDMIIPDSAIKNRLTVNAAFISNAFAEDQFAVGLEYSYRSFLMLRGGFVYQNGVLTTTSPSAFAGPCAGISVDIPFGKDRGNKDKAKRLAVEYSYRAAAPFGGTHSIGLRLNM